MIPQVFSAAREVDQAFMFILAFAVGILVLVTVLMLFFAWRYHHTRNPQPTEIPGSLALELLWTVIPSIIVMAMFWFGWSSFKAMRTVPEGALAVAVEGRMWSWSFTYPGGKRSPVLVAPVGRDVKLSMTSRDVIHSFYVPAMRIKMDTVPGLTTTAWFNSDSLGEFDILCAEYCGLKHANMLSTLKVVSEEDFERWFTEGDRETVRVSELFRKYGCNSCHALDGSGGVGPSLANLGGRQVDVVLPGGAVKTVVSDREYLRRAVLDPGAEVVSGYEPAMPPYEGDVTEEDLTAMVNWMLTGDTVGVPPGRAVAEAEGCLSCHSTDGSFIAGPSFKGLFGASRDVVDESGAKRTVVADEGYLRESILRPGALVVQGQDPIMPGYEALGGEQLGQLLEYVKSLGAAGGQAGKAEEVGKAGEAADSVAAQGLEDLAFMGCTACHSLDGSEGVGPTFRGIYGGQREVTDESGAGRTVTVDDEYLRQSITSPGALVVKGFGPMMPAYGDMDEATLARMIAAMESLGAGDGK